MVVATLNRGSGVLHLIRTLLANGFEPLEILVVDQSHDHRTRKAVENFDPRVTYLHRKPGLSAARNAGAARARYPLLAFTDDDCSVPSNWLETISRSFRQYPEARLLFGNVMASPHDVGRDFIVSQVRSHAASAASLLGLHRVGGLGACMVVRRSLWDRLGGFDERLGLGAHFGAGEELDLTIRVLLQGSPVFYAPELWVTHHGTHPVSQRKALIRRYLYGTGAVYAKHLRAGQLGILVHLGLVAAGFLQGRVGVDFGHEQARWQRLLGFCHGFMAGLGWPERKEEGHRAGGENRN